MYNLEVRKPNGRREYYGPFPTEDRARSYANSAGWDPGMSSVIPLIVPYAVVQQIVYRRADKPVVSCELVNIGQVHGHPSNVHRANIQRTSDHPRLGADREGTMTVTSQVLRVDFELGVMETLNTVYKFEGVNRHG